MNALTIFIRRPVLASMVTLLFIVLGIFSYRLLGVDLMPKVEIPVVTIRTILPGASPEEIETQVSKPIEEAVNTIAGIDELLSYNFEGYSIVVVRFLLDRAMDEAVQDVRDKVSAAMAKLPADVEPPVVTKIDFDAQAVVTLTVSGPRDMKEVSEVARLKVKESLENVSGVGSITVVGNRERAINVFLRIDRLRAYGIPIAQVKGALAAQNIEIPSGRLDRGADEQVLRTLARVERVSDFEKLVVATRQGRQITIGDLGRVEDSVEEPRSLARTWQKGDPEPGTSTVSLDIVKQTGTNTLDVIKAVKKRVAELEPTLPKGYRIGVVGDQSIFIERSIDELILHLVLGGLLAALAVLLFMRNVRSTLIAAVAIPTSLVGTFAAMKLFGFTLNNMTLLGLTLSVGIVIDDAIVVLENIFRHMEQYGKSAFQAAMDGLKEIGMAVMATTTSLIVIFLPLAMMQGMTGRFFYEFGITTAVAIAISLIVSFTLTPMLSARFLKIKPGKAHQGHGAIERGYGAIIGFSLRHRWIVLLTAVLVLVSTVPIVKNLGKDFMPLDDRSEFQVYLVAPAGMSLSSVDNLFARIERTIHGVRGVERTLTAIGSSGSEDVTRGTIYVGITDLAERDYSQEDAMKEVRALLAAYPEVRSSVNNLSGMGGGSRRSTFSYNITGPDLDELVRISDQMAKRLRETPGFVDIDTSLASRQPEVRMAIDRSRAADLGITAADVAMSVRTMVGGERATKYREGVEQFDVWLRLDKADRADADGVGQMPIVSARAGVVPLSQVVDLTEGRGPSQIDRMNRQRQVTIFANLDGIDLGSASATADRVFGEVNTNPAYRHVSAGTAKMMGEAITNMIMAFALAFIFMYIVLAAQFESFVHPITILLSLPLTLPFAMLSLLLLGETLNIYSLLGVFMLFGIVKKNGILQIDYTNTLMAKGHALKDAIIEANQARLRPILMTTLTLIAGMAPIALGQGPGAAARASMAKVIIGGQALSLFITLLIVPVAYSLFEGAKRKLGLATKEYGNEGPDESPVG